MSSPAVRSNEGALQLSFRQAQAADALSVHALATQVFLDTYATEGVRPALAREAEQRYSTSVFLELLERPASRIILAERDDHLVAFAQVQLGAGHALVEGPAAAELERLYVQAPFLRRGVGRQLLARAEALARDEGCTTLWLTAWAGNVRALAFYRSQEYEERGSTIYEIEGSSFENRLFARALDGGGSAAAATACGDAASEAANAFRVSTAKAELDLGLIHRFLSEQSSWAEGIPFDTMRRSIEHSLCFGGYLGAAQVAFARVVSDRATFANLVDVFVLDAHRGRGYGKAIVQAVLAHPSLQGLRRFTLATGDAHGLYAQFGFAAPVNPEAFMERHVPGVYSQVPLAAEGP